MDDPSLQSIEKNKNPEKNALRKQRRRRPQLGTKKRVLSAFLGSGSSALAGRGSFFFGAFRLVQRPPKQWKKVPSVRAFPNSPALAAGSVDVENARTADAFLRR